MTHDESSVITLVTYCSKDKSKDPNPLPAIKHYKSCRIKSVFAKAKGEKHCMFILSGLLGLIRPDTPIMWYEKRLMPSDVGIMVDLVSHHLLCFKIRKVEYITEDIWLKPEVKPYHDLMAASCSDRTLK